MKRDFIELEEFACLGYLPLLGTQNERADMVAKVIGYNTADIKRLYEYAETQKLYDPESVACVGDKKNLKDHFATSIGCLSVCKGKHIEQDTLTDLCSMCAYNTFGKNTCRYFERKLVAYQYRRALEKKNYEVSGISMECSEVAVGALKGKMVTFAFSQFYESLSKILESPNKQKELTGDIEKDTNAISDYAFNLKYKAKLQKLKLSSEEEKTLVKDFVISWLKQFVKKVLVTECTEEELNDALKALTAQDRVAPYSEETYHREFKRAFGKASDYESLGRAFGDIGGGEDVEAVSAETAAHIAEQEGDDWVDENELIARRKAELAAQQNKQSPREEPEKLSSNEKEEQKEPSSENKEGKDPGDKDAEPKDKEGENSDKEKNENKTQSDGGKQKESRPDFQCDDSVRFDNDNGVILSISNTENIWFLNSKNEVGEYFESVYDSFYLNCEYVTINGKSGLLFYSQLNEPKAAFLEEEKIDEDFVRYLYKGDKHTIVCCNPVLLHRIALKYGIPNPEIRMASLSAQIHVTDGSNEIYPLAVLMRELGINETLSSEIFIGKIFRKYDDLFVKKYQQLFGRNEEGEKRIKIYNKCKQFEKALATTFMVPNFYKVDTPVLKRHNYIKSEYQLNGTLKKKNGGTAIKCEYRFADAGSGDFDFQREVINQIINNYPFNTMKIKWALMRFDDNQFIIHIHLGNATGVNLVKEGIALAFSEAARKRNKAEIEILFATL